MSGLPTVVFTDLPDQAKEMGVFDQVFRHASPVGGYRDKILPLLNLPFQQTLYLDSDTRILAPIKDIFDSASNSHFAAAHAPVRKPSGWNDEAIPSIFPEFNSGVILLRRSFRQRLLIKRWLRLYDHLALNRGQTWDQASLRSALWWMITHTYLRVCVLPSEANLRITKPWIAGKGISVYILHGRIPEAEMSEFLHYLNSEIGCFRTWSDWLHKHPDSMIRPKLPPYP
ncbi:hypothetical protein [Synechococcus sp. GEYO]|uniref:hypothetical protein n=1 Tax=Synechococcus sp. GEYO TaxID=2575511 RepID=UPI0010BD42EC|nr:hypothetical protein [Synechococcus sp. GEYO]